MVISVACPSCGAVLKAPADMVGKKARCKKCQHSFRIPGGPAVDTVGDSEHLSVVDTPFDFAAASAAAPALPIHSVPSIVAETRSDDEPMPAVEDTNPFAMASPMVSLPKSKSTAKAPAAEGSKSKYRTGTTEKPGSAKVEKSKSSYRAKAAEGAPVAKSKGKLVGIMVGVVLLAAGAGGAVFVMNSLNKPETPAVASVPAEPAVPEAKNAAEKPAVAKSKKPAEEKAVESADAAGGEPAQGAQNAGATSARAQVRVKTTGGLALPPVPMSFAPFENAKDTITIETPIDKMSKVIFGGKETPMVLVAWKSFSGFQGQGAEDTVDRYVLSSGRRVDQTKIGADVKWPKAGDLSPSGDRLIVEAPPGKLTVYRLGTVEKPLDAFAPFSDQPKPPGIAAAYFLDDETIAVVSTLGTVDVWVIAAKSKKVAGKPVPGVSPMSPLKAERTVTIAPDRKTIAIYAAGTVYEVPLSTCVPKPGLTLGYNPGAGLALAIDGSGTRIAVAYQPKEGNYTRIANARFGDPKAAGDFYLSEDCGLATRAEWLGSDLFAYQTDKAAFAYDAEENKSASIACVRPSAKGEQFFSSDRHWFLSANPKDAKTALLVGTPFPPDSYLPFRNAGQASMHVLTATSTGLHKGAEKMAEK